MAVQVIESCDRCKKVKTEKLQLWTAGVVYVYATSSRLNYTTGRSTQLHAHLCRTCMSEFGGVFETDDKNKKVEPPSPLPTIEDYVRELIANEVSDQLSNR